MRYHLGDLEFNFMSVTVHTTAVVGTMCVNVYIVIMPYPKLVSYPVLEVGAMDDRVTVVGVCSIMLMPKRLL